MKMNVQFTERHVEILERMADDLGASKSGVIRRALALLEVAIREKKQGNALAVMDVAGNVVKEIVGIFN